MFGWEATPLGEEGAGSFFCLPSYGDFLEELNPGTRARNAELGGPERFEEAVAWVMPSDDAPPHWGVTFGVDDADATAAKARELGGQVLVEPMDAPWVRIAVLQDPQGAVFTASKFVPPS